MKQFSLLRIAILAGSLVAMASSGIAQRKGGGGGGGSHGGGGARSSGGGGRSSGGGPPVHAQRETVRTKNFVPRQSSGPVSRSNASAHQTQNNVRQPNYVTPRKTINGKAPAVQAQRTFTKTAAGRKYDNGLVLRKGVADSAAWQHRYFPRGHYHFPYYQTSFTAGCFISPFGFFYGVCVPFIGNTGCFLYPPTSAFVDIPIYEGSQCTGFVDAGDDNMMNDPTLDQDEPGLENAIDDLSEAFLGGNIDGLVTLINPNMTIAVYLRGKYQYSIAANNYIDLARDAIQSMHTDSFSLTYLHQRAPGVFSVGGQQTYQDANGHTQTTWVSFVLQDISGQWTLTQVGNAPGIYRSPTF